MRSERWSVFRLWRILRQGRARDSALFGIALAMSATAQSRIPQHWMPAGTPVSAESPFSATCDAGQAGTHYRHAAVETWLTIDPRDPLHLIGGWQQDRWSNGGASGLLASVSFDG